MEQKSTITTDENKAQFMKIPEATNRNDNNCQALAQNNERKEEFKKTINDYLKQKGSNEEMGFFLTAVVYLGTFLIVYAATYGALSYGEKITGVRL